jgi:hypothetical protein
MIPITWLFAVWGLDLVGPLKRTTGGFTHLLVAIEKVRGLPSREIAYAS